MHTETFQTTCTLEAVLYEFRHRFEVVVELNYPHCSKRLHYTQFQINWSYLLTVTKLLAYLGSIPLLKLLAKMFLFTYVLCNLRIYAILRLRCAFSESRDCTLYCGFRSSCNASIQTVMVRQPITVLCF